MSSGVFAGTLNDGNQVLLVLQKPNYFLQAGNFASKGSYDINSIELTGTGVAYDLTASNQNAGNITIRGEYKTNRHIQLTWQDPSTGMQQSVVVQGSSLYFKPSPIDNVLGSWVNQSKNNLTFFTVSLNHKPIPGDDFFAVQPGVQSDLPVLANDRDPDGDPIYVSRVDSASTAGGKVVLDDNGTPNDHSDDRVLYTPPANITSGTDTFTYDVNDTNKGTAKATVTLTFPVRNADIGLSMSADNEAPMAGDIVSVAATLTNNSNVDIEAEVYIDIPDGLSYRDDDGGGTFTPSTGFWIITVPASQSTTLNLKLLVGDYGNFDLKGTIQTYDVADTDASNNSAEVTFVPGGLSSKPPSKPKSAQVQGVLLSTLTQITGTISESPNGYNAYPVSLSVGSGLGGNGGTSDPYTGFVIISSEVVKAPTGSSNGVSGPRPTMLILTANPNGAYLNKLYYVTQQELAQQTQSASGG